jgi:hypothetical protein
MVTSAALGVINAVRLRPLPYPELPPTSVRTRALR